MDVTSEDIEVPDVLRLLRLLGVRALGLAAVTAVVGLPTAAIALTLIGSSLLLARVRQR